MNVKQKATPKRVRFPEDPRDMQVLKMAVMGYGFDFIAESVGYTRSQAYYRAHKVHITPMAYRRGQSPYAALAYKETNELIEKRLFNELTKEFPELMKPLRNGRRKKR